MEKRISETKEVVLEQTAKNAENYNEMLRICKEVRISPLVDLDGARPDFYEKLIAEIKQEYEVTIRQTNYVFLKSENSYLSIKK